MIDLNFKIAIACNAQFVEVSKTSFHGFLNYSHQFGGEIKLYSKSFNRVFDRRSFELVCQIKLLSGTLKDGRPFSIINPFLSKSGSFNHGMYELTFTFKYLIVGSRFSKLESIMA